MCSLKELCYLSITVFFAISFFEKLNIEIT
jgi:hypothetical protein